MCLTLSTNAGPQPTQRGYVQDILCWVLNLRARSTWENHAVDKDDWDFLNAEIGDQFP